MKRLSVLLLAMLILLAAVGCTPSELSADPDNSERPIETDRSQHFAATPERSETPVNVYDASKAINGYWNQSGQYVADPDFRVSEPIAVRAGDVITFGAADPLQAWHISLFDADENCLGMATVAGGIETKETLSDGGVIMSYTVADGVGFVRMVSNQNDSDEYLVTINDSFTAAEYNEYLNARSQTSDASEPTDAVTSD